MIPVDDGFGGCLGFGRQPHIEFFVLLLLHHHFPDDVKIFGVLIDTASPDARSTNL